MLVEESFRPYLFQLLYFRICLISLQYLHSLPTSQLKHPFHSSFLLYLQLFIDFPFLEIISKNVQFVSP